MTAMLVQNGFHIRPSWEDYDVRRLLIEDRGNILKDIILQK
jgi:hypothetical protein